LAINIPASVHPKILFEITPNYIKEGFSPATTKEMQVIHKRFTDLHGCDERNFECIYAYVSSLGVRRRFPDDAAGVLDEFAGKYFTAPCANKLTTHITILIICYNLLFN
jgi:hypothetical protein